MAQNEPIDTSRPLAFYFLVLLLFFAGTFIGYNFGRLPGAIVGFLFATLVNGYAITIKPD